MVNLKPYAAQCSATYGTGWTHILLSQEVPNLAAASMAVEILSSMTTCAAVTAGDVLLDGLRVNQLKLSRNLTGSLQVSEKEVHMHAKV